jgi:hypothetical protein
MPNTTQIRRAGVITSALAIVAIAASCSTGADVRTPLGGDVATTTAAATNDDERAAFIAAADQLCQTQHDAVTTAERDLGNAPTDAEIETFVRNDVVPLFRRNVADIRALGIPAGDEAQLEAILDEVSHVIDTIEEDPLQAMAGDPFAAVDQKLSAYGFHVCNT